MISNKEKFKNIFSQKNIEVFFAILSLFSFAYYYNYSNHQEYIDEQKMEVATSSINIAVKNSEIKINKSTTTIPILVYHKIDSPFLLSLPTDHRPIRKFNVQVDVFQSQMKFIQEQGYTPLTMQDLISDEKNNTLPIKPIAITFDDGWRSQYENAVPILNKYHIPATFYIYTGVIGSSAYMTWDDLHSLVNLNMEIGDHTKTHPRLTKIDPNQLEEELIQSKNILERNLHVKVTDFAYPYGNYNSAIIDAVKKSGYQSARTSNHGIKNDFSDLYQLNVLYAPSSLEAFKEALRK